MAVMSFETGGTFNPGILNVAGSGATGLIQFMPELQLVLVLAQKNLLACLEHDRCITLKSTCPTKVSKVNLSDLYMAVQLLL